MSPDLKLAIAAALLALGTGWVWLRLVRFVWSLGQSDLASPVDRDLT